jgi:hypothetical protein
MPTLQTLRQNLRTTKQVVQDDLTDYVRGRRNGPAVSLDPVQERLLADLRRDGFAILPNYWPRDKALALRDKLEGYLELGRDTDFDEGAWMRFWDHRPYDQGVRRIYHVERLVPELKDVRFDPFVLDIASAYYRMPFHSQVLMFQHNTQSNEQTRYYHVDAFVREFKSFIYLDDVDPGNGPFAYLRGTHKNHLARLRKQVQGNPEGESPTTFYPEDLGDLLGEEIAVNGQAGTLILTDVRGLHRGTPQVDRSRSVLVNYILKHPGDKILDK